MGIEITQLKDMPFFSGHILTDNNVLFSLTFLSVHLWGVFEVI